MRNLSILLLVILVAFLLVAASPNPASAASPTYHIVQPGQNLSWIASWYHVDMWTLARWNGIANPNYIYVGQVLTIPGGYPNPYPCPGCWYPAPRPNPYPGPIYRCAYRVQYGDTMTGIAWRLGMDPWTLARANGIYNLNWIYAGQVLRVPGCY